jgi:asparagine synthetase B (glutamine-hydrolysing)
MIVRCQPMVIHGARGIRMLFQIDATTGSSTPAGSAPATWITVGDGVVTIEGDPVHRRQCFVHASRDHLIASDLLDEVTDAMRAADIPVVPSPYGVSHTLTTGYVPLPQTAIEGVYRLASGDTLTARYGPGGITAEMTNRFPWIQSHSAEDRVPDTTQLRALLAAATDAQLAEVDGDTTLMLSSGKDSVSLAVALADSGHTEVRTITYKASENDREHEYAADLCRRLGLSHEVVTLPEDPATVRRAVMRFFEESPHPSVDLTTVPYALVTQTYVPQGGGVMDGSGSDLYVGYPVGWKPLAKSSLRVRPRSLSEAVRRRLPVDSQFNYFTRSRIGATIPLRLYRTHDIEGFYPDAIDPDDFWYAESRRGGNSIDLFSVTEVRHHDPARLSTKIHFAARAAGVEPVLPWCDTDVAEYYFNLPEADRYDRRRRETKTLVRRMLADAVGYDEAEVGAHYFAFDVPRFLIDQEDFVRDEILGCDLWDASIEPLLTEWQAALPERPFISHSLHALFMVSGWHNHSRHLST